MAIQFSIDTARKCVFGTATSDVSNEDVVAYQRALADHPEHRAGFDMLLDFRLARGDLVTSDGLRRASFVAEQYSSFLAGCKCAVVVANPLAFGMARVFQAVASQALEVQVFYEVDQARRWIGLDEGDEEPRSRRAGA